ncbi:MAG: alpha/beta hydrolase [Anaerolineales bacterium]|nr:alpha/beta hydrolase [Anaerolineales bacterium]
MKRKYLIPLALVVIMLFGITLLARRPGDQSRSCMDFYAGMHNPPAAAHEWCLAGAYFPWESTLHQNAEFEALNIFHICQGDPSDPAILMIHGYPTSSFDFAALMMELSQDHYVCALDTPGYGFSDKPQEGFDYSIFDDAQLVDDYIRNVAVLDDFTLLTHDKGDSVGLALLAIYQAYDEQPYTINHHFIANGNIYLPLAQLTAGQRVLLSPVAGPVVSSLLTADRLANTIAETTFADPLPQGEIEAYASIFAFQDGPLVQHDIIMYLDERAEHEVAWLEALADSEIPTTLIWGELDVIAPVAVPDHVWTNYLEYRAAPAAYWRIPCADHYLQVDDPLLLADIVRSAISGEPSSSEISGRHCQAGIVESNH